SGLMKKYSFTIVMSILLCLIFCTPIGATTRTSLLKEELEANYMYYSVTIDELNKALKNDPKGFKKDKDGLKVVISGIMKKGSVFDEGKKIKMYDPDSSKVAIVDSSSKGMTAKAKKLKVNDIIAVYGTLKCSGIRDIEYSIEALNIVINPKTQIPNHQYAFIDETFFVGNKVDDLTPQKRITFYTPETWQNDFVKDSLTNNGVKGYQYFLNALDPQNLEYPENFYIFYFNNFQYLKKPTKNNSEWYNEKIEKKIIENITQKLGIEDKKKIKDIENVYGKEFDYYSTPYEPGNNEDYRLEFVFLPDNDGITCMLYLYFPKDGAFNHVKDVVYVINSLRVSS
ncbi:MAG: hypothetical protein K6F73_03105, partial [Lachnospiraceae bacterium]|nr:hypothetical protein [Lachnospiraceae bacterium]